MANEAYLKTQHVKHKNNSMMQLEKSKEKSIQLKKLMKKKKQKEKNLRTDKKTPEAKKTETESKNPL
ncbi:hypothetical protein MMC08_005966 [Hypocenomyce scalaris]|nr:hypothetical protein [Hypocenomyce scalaris]